MTDDEELPPHIIMIKNNSELDGERQPPPSCLTQTSPRGSQPTPSPPPRMEEQQEYIEAEEPKREPEVAPTYPASPTTQTPSQQNLQTYLMSLERDLPQYVEHNHGAGDSPAGDALGLGASSG